MLWIGITGPMACGKSTVANKLSHLGCPFISADELAREVLIKFPDLLEQIKTEFGSDIFTHDGQLIRKALGDIVFSNPLKLKDLEKLTHPFIQKEVLEKKNQFQKTGLKIAIYDVPLLFENQLQDQFDKIIVVACSIEMQIKRSALRDNLSPSQILDRINKQLPLEHKIKGSDYVLWNNSECATNIDHLYLWLSSLT